MLDVYTTEERFDAPPVYPVNGIDQEIVVSPVNTLVLGLINTIEEAGIIYDDLAGPTDLVNTIRMALDGVTEEDIEEWAAKAPEGERRSKRQGPATGNKKSHKKKRRRKKNRDTYGSKGKRTTPQWQLDVNRKMAERKAAEKAE